MRVDGLIVVAALVLGSAAVARAQTYSCTDLAKQAKSRCEKANQHTKKKACDVGLGLGDCKPCCVPAPCEYYYELQMWIMLQAMFADKTVVACAPPGKVEDTVKSIGESQLFKSFLPTCNKPFEGKSIDLRSLGLDTGENGFRSACETRGDGLLVTRQIANARWNTCSELVAMVFDHEQVHMDVCSAMVKNKQKYDALSNEAIAREEQKAYGTAIAGMQRQLKQWPTQCSVVKDTKLALKNAKAGIKALKSAAKAGGGCK